jgi:hypothetical protein
MLSFVPHEDGVGMTKILSSGWMRKRIVKRIASAGFASAVVALWPALAAETPSVPNFGMDATVGWIAGVQGSDEPIGDDFLPPPSGPGPVVSDKDHPYIDNAFALRTGKQPTFHVAIWIIPSFSPGFGRS